MTGPLLWIIVGLIGLAVGTDLAVRAVGDIAQRLRVSPLLIGLTVASIGTSLPEIATNVAVGVNTLSGTDSSGIAVGNIVGSCMSQITLLLGIAAMAHGLAVKTLPREGTMLVVALLGMVVVSIDGVVGRTEAGLLVIVYLAYLAVLVRQAMAAPRVQDDDAETDRGRLAVDLGKAGAALVVVVVCADLVVDQGVAIASALDVGDTIIGVFVGFGTGLPELAVALGASLRGKGGLAIGNLIGSNITDPLLSFGLGALVHPVTVDLVSLQVDFVFWGAATAVALLLMASDRRLKRGEALVLIILFALYLYVRLVLPA